MPKKHVDVNKLMHRFQNLDAPTALDVLCVGFGASNARVVESGSEKSVSDLYDNPWIYRKNTKASDVRIRFLGGPPKQVRWLPGSLLSMTIDMMAYAHVTSDIVGIKRSLKVLGDKIYG